MLPVLPTVASPFDVTATAPSTYAPFVYTANVASLSIVASPSSDCARMPRPTSPFEYTWTSLALVTETSPAPATARMPTAYFALADTIPVLSTMMSPYAEAASMPIARWPKTEGETSMSPPLATVTLPSTDWAEMP